MEKIMLNFNEWLNRPVYKSQVYTFNVLRELLSLPAGNLATTPDHPIMYFRIFPPYRNGYSKNIRKQVADKVRELRKSGNYQLKTVSE
jgi:hypothetical protein